MQHQGGGKSSVNALARRGTHFSINLTDEQPRNFFVVVVGGIPVVVTLDAIEPHVLVLQKHRKIVSLKRLQRYGAALRASGTKADSRSTRGNARLPVFMKKHGILVGLDELGVADNELVRDRLAAVSADEHTADQVRHSAPLPGCLHFYGMRHTWRKKHGDFYLIRHRLALVTLLTLVLIVSVMSVYYKENRACRLPEIPNFGTNSRGGPYAEQEHVFQYWRPLHGLRRFPGEGGTLQ